MSSVLIKHDSGLGDHLRCHGIVREYCKRYERVGLLCRPALAASVEFMFRDLIAEGRLTLHLAANFYEEQRIIAEKKYDTLVRAEAFEEESYVKSERQYYKRAGVPFQKKWESFKVERDHERENAMLASVNPPGHFILLHQEPEKEYMMDRSLITSALPVIEPGKDFSKPLFDYCALIEKADELHVIESSFYFLIDLLPYENPSQKLFLHRYARPNPEWINSVPKKPWTILT